jgi:hypothetical protein
MAEEEHVSQTEADYRLLALVMSLATAAWSQLGKIPHPVSQKIEIDLQQAQVTIDFLRMLLEKTQGNLKPKEQEMLTNVVSDLEMNFADEAAKPQASPQSKTPDIIIPSRPPVDQRVGTAPTIESIDRGTGPSGAGKGPEIIKP